MNKPLTQKDKDRVQEIAHVLKKRGTINREEMARFLDVSYTGFCQTWAKALNYLINKSCIQFIGKSQHGAKWRLVKPIATIDEMLTYAEKAPEETPEGEEQPVTVVKEGAKPPVKHEVTHRSNCTKTSIEVEGIKITIERTYS